MRYGQLSSVLYVISSLVSLSVILLCIWIVSRGGSGRTSEKLKKSWEPGMMPIVQPQGKRTIWVSTLALLMGIGAGYGIRDHQFSSNLITYTDVTVVKKFADNEFLVWPDRMKQQHIRLCAESVVAWRDNEILDDWTFEQKRGCKRVVSYHEKLKGEIDASIQVR